MTLAARHLQTRRPRKDRDVTWSRSFRNGLVMWTFWRRDHRGAWHLLDKSITAIEIDHMRPGVASDVLRAAHRELRDFVDEIDLKAMENVA